MTRWTRATAYAAVAVTAVACGDLVNHDDERPRRTVPVAALYLDAGLPTALLAPCAGTHVIDLTVSDGVRQLWTVGDNDPPDPASTVRIFTVPDGWKLDKASTAGFTELAADHSYHLFTGLSYGVDRATSDSAYDLTFTLAELTALRPDEVWTVTEASASARATPRAEFQRAASAVCG